MAFSYLICRWADSAHRAFATTSQRGLPLGVLLTCLVASAGQAQAPVVTAVLPARNALGVAPTAPVQVSFSQPLNGAALTSREVQVFSSQLGGRKAGTTIASGNTLTFTPSVAFRAGETVSANATTFVQASNGQYLATPQVFQFTTAVAPSGGTFGAGASVGVGAMPASPSPPALGDIDGDGDLDLVVATSTGASVRRNDGLGNFNGSQEVIVGGGGGSSQGVLGDFDNDGDLDLALGLKNVVAILSNDGTGTFTTTQNIRLGVNIRSLALADVNNNGFLDLLAFDDNANLIVVRNVGAMFASSGASLRTGDTYPYRLVLGDIDNDGDLDVLTYSYYFHVSVCTNQGGGFAVTQQLGGAIGGGGYLDDVALGDIDGDGDLDLLTASYSSSRVSVRRNDGTGSFSGAETVDFQARGPVTLALGDVDGDGDLDLVVTNSNTSTLGVRLNDGTGSFSGSQEALVSNQPTASPNGLALGDLDTNGTLDAVVASANGTLVYTLLNKSTLRVPDNPAGTVAGLHYQYYEAASGSGFAQLPDFAALTPVKSGTIAGFDVASPRLRNYAYALRFTGYVTVPSSGQYTFYTTSDDGSQLLIGSTLVVDNNGQHGIQEQAGTIGLQAGTHALTVTYFQSGGGTALSVSYQEPNGNKQVIPAASLRRVATSNVALATKPAELETWHAAPNPFSSYVGIDFSLDQADNYTLTVHDLMGRLVGKPTAGQVEARELNHIELPTNTYSSGLYLVRLQMASGTQRVFRIVKE